MLDFAMCAALQRLHYSYHDSASLVERHRCRLRIGASLKSWAFFPARPSHQVQGFRVYGLELGLSEVQLPNPIYHSPGASEYNAGAFMIKIYYIRVIARSTNHKSELNNYSGLSNLFGAKTRLICAKSLFELMTLASGIGEIRPQ